MPGQWGVMNAGYSGMSTLHMLQLLSAKLLPFVIPWGKLLIFIGQSDANALTSRKGYWDPRPTITPIKPPVNHDDLPWESGEMLERVIDGFLSLADALGIDYAVVASPFRDADLDDPVMKFAYGENQARFKRVQNSRFMIQEVARMVTNNHGRPFLDGQRLASDPSLFYDIMHLNEDGQRVFADGLNSWLQSDVLAVPARIGAHV